MWRGSIKYKNLIYIYFLHFKGWRPPSTLSIRLWQAVLYIIQLHFSCFIFAQKPIFIQPVLHHLVFGLQVQKLCVLQLSLILPELCFSIFFKSFLHWHSLIEFGLIPLFSLITSSATIYTKILSTTYSFQFHLFLVKIIYWDIIIFIPTSKLLLFMKPGESVLS